MKNPTKKPTHPYLIGENYFIRTSTYHYTGKLLQVYDNELVFGTAAWIPVSNRFADSMKTGDFNEVEPYPEDTQIVISRTCLVDACPVTFPLPTQQK